MAGWRRLQRCCDAVGLALAEAADGLAAAGSGPPADVALAAEGSVTEATARVEAERARAAAGFPVLRDAVAAGHVGAANLDGLARTLEGFTADEVAAMQERDHEMAGVVVRLGPDSFRRWLHRVRDRIRADHGSGAAERARRDAFVRISPDRERRGYRVSGWLPALDGAAARAALDSEYRRLVRPHPDTDDRSRREHAGRNDELDGTDGASGGGGAAGSSSVRTPDVLLDPDRSPREIPGGGPETAPMILARAFTGLLIRGANTTPSFANQRVGVEVTVLADGRPGGRSGHGPKHLHLGAARVEHTPLGSSTPRSGRAHPAATGGTASTAT